MTLWPAAPSRSRSIDVKRHSREVGCLRILAGRQRHAETGATARARHQFESTAHPGDDLARDCKAESSPRRRVVAAALAARKHLENRLRVLRRNARTVVGNFDNEVPIN